MLSHLQSELEMKDNIRSILSMVIKRHRLPPSSFLKCRRNNYIQVQCKITCHNLKGTKQYQDLLPEVNLIHPLSLYTQLNAVNRKPHCSH